MQVIALCTTEPPEALAEADLVFAGLVEATEFLVALTKT
jgi:hypothetical protein